MNNYETVVTVLIFVASVIGLLMLLVWRTQTNSMKSLRLQLGGLIARRDELHTSANGMLSTALAWIEDNVNVFRPEDIRVFKARHDDLSNRLKQLEGKLVQYDLDSMSGRDLKAALQQLNGRQLLNNLDRLEKEIQSLETDVVQSVDSNYRELACLKSRICTLIQSRDELWKRIRTALSQCEQQIGENVEILSADDIRMFSGSLKDLKQAAQRLEIHDQQYCVTGWKREPLENSLHQLRDRSLLHDLALLVDEVEGLRDAVRSRVNHVLNIVQRSSQLNHILFDLWKDEAHVMGCELRDELHRRLLAVEQLVPLVQLLVAARDYRRALELLQPVEEGLQKIRRAIDENERQRESIRDELANVRRKTARFIKRPTGGAFNEIAETVYGYVATHRTLRDSFLAATSDALMAGNLEAAEKWLDKTTTEQEAVDRGAEILNRLLQHEGHMASIHQAMTELLGGPQPVKLQAVLSALTQVSEPAHLHALWPTIEQIMVELESLVTALDVAMMASLVMDDIRNDGRKAITGLVHETTQLEAFLALENVNLWPEAMVPLIQSWYQQFEEVVEVWQELLQEQEKLFAEKQPANDISHPSSTN